MKKELCIQVEGTPCEEIRLVPTRLINAGYTGRDQDEVRAYIEQVQSLGIHAPDKTPCIYPKTPALIETSEELLALDADCAGEGEYVFFRHKGEDYLGCGSDLYDKRVCGMDYVKAKHMYPNMMAPQAWRWREVEAHFDALVLRSWVGGGREILYQEGGLDTMLRPDDLIRMYREDGEPEPGEGFVMFGGTLPYLLEEMLFADTFEVELADPVLGRAITCRYHISLIR